MKKKVPKKVLERFKPENPNFKLDVLKFCHNIDERNIASTSIPLTTPV